MALIDEGLLDIVDLDLKGKKRDAEIKATAESPEVPGPATPKQLSIRP